MHLAKKFELYDEGIVSLDDIPDDLVLPQVSSCSYTVIKVVKQLLIEPQLRNS
ncbi:MAG: hypothetical protein H6609_17040 [Ignavibacteriales bacterium]|nr:hypothetical protein [Ignavibacteriales bacterium]